MPDTVTRDEFKTLENRVQVLESDSDGEKRVTRYINLERPTSSLETVFLANSTTPMRVRTQQKTVERLCVEADIPRLTPHAESPSSTRPVMSGHVGSSMAL